MDNKYKAQSKYRKEKLMAINGAYKTDFVLEFKEACKILGIAQSQVIKKAMEETIANAREIKK